MDNSPAPKGPTPDAYDAACRALWAHRDRADALAAALDSIRVWRHTQPHTDPAAFAGLDAVLNAAILDGAAPLLLIQRPESLPEAVTAYRQVLRARQQALAATRLVWDQVEAAAIREIDRHLPRGGVA